MFFAVLLLIFVVLAFLLYTPDRTLFVTVFLLPWESLLLDVGLNVYPYRIFLAAFVFYIILQLGRGGRLARPSHWLVMYSLWGIGVSLVYMMGYLSGVTGLSFRGSGTRILFQVVRYIMTISPVILIPSLLRSLDDVWHLARWYLVAIVVLCVLGWFQLLVWSFTGTDLFPKGFLSGFLGLSDYSGSAYVFLKTRILRMSSLGGDPKRMGQSICIAMFLLQAAYLYDILSWRRFAWIWSFLAASMLITFSTSAFFLWAIGSTVTGIAAWFNRRSRHLSSNRSTRLLAIVLTLGFFLVGSRWTYETVTTEESASFASTLDARLDRTEDDEWIPIEDYDEPIWKLVLNEPFISTFGTGLGNAHVHARKYMEDVWWDKDEQIIVAKTGALRIWSEVGIIGLFLFLAWCSHRFLQLYFSRNYPRDVPDAEKMFNCALVFWATIVASYLARGYVREQFFFTAGVITFLVTANFTTRKKDVEE